MRALTGLLLLCLPALASATTLYRYVDPAGVVHFTDKQPSRGAKPYRLEHPLSMPLAPHGRGYEPPLQSPPFAVHFNTPTPGQAYAINADVRVSVSVMPGLARGYGLIFRVDGQPREKTPLSDIRSTLHGLPAGKHEISAALIGPSGRELARSAPVTIHIDAQTAQEPRGGARTAGLR
ncbi:MAG: DUF4124 domain-containing protein [Stenotrophobium sp.]